MLVGAGVPSFGVRAAKLLWELDWAIDGDLAGDLHGEDFNGDGEDLNGDVDGSSTGMTSTEEEKERYVCSG
jgi:hypothetical protein